MALTQEQLNEVHTNARRGAALLDAKGPSYWYRTMEYAIAEGRFSIVSSEDCVCGVLYGDYSQGLDALFPETINGFNFRGDKAHNHGFLNFGYDFLDSMTPLNACHTLMRIADELENEWKRAVMERVANDLQKARKHAVQDRTLALSSAH